MLNAARPQKEVQAQPPEQKAMVAMAERFGMDLGGLSLALRATVLPGEVKDPNTGKKRSPTEGEVYGLCVAANRYQLDPFVREIYAFPKKGGGIVPVVGVDGWLRIINQHPQFDGMTAEIEWTPGSEEIKSLPFSCTVTIFRKDRAQPTQITEYLDECRRPTEPWNQMPARMTRNRAICQAARVAFGISGIMLDDEAETIRDVEFEVLASKPDEAPGDLGTIAGQFAEEQRAEGPSEDPGLPELDDEAERRLDGAPDPEHAEEA